MFPVALAVTSCTLFGVAHLVLAWLRPADRGAHASCAAACLLTAAACALAPFAPIGGAA